MVQVVTGDDLILDALVVQLHGVVRIVAPEHEEVLDLELIQLRPPHLEAGLLGLRLVGFVQGCLVKEVENLFVVYLKEGNADIDCAILAGRCLLEQIPDSSDAEPRVSIVDLNFTGSLFALFSSILISLHRVSLARTGLSISEHCCVEPIDHF